MTRVRRATLLMLIGLIIPMAPFGGVAQAFFHDTTPPTSSISLSGTLGTNGWYRTSVTVSLSCADADSGCARTEYRLNGGPWVVYTTPFTVSGNGSNLLEYRSFDIAGNAESVRNRTIKIDTADPFTSRSLSGVPGSNGWYRTAVTVALSCVDATSGCARSEYRLNGGSATVYSGPFTISTDGTSKLEFKSIDNAGNHEPLRSIIIRIDTVAPLTTRTVTGTQGTNGWYASPATVTFSCADAASGCAGTEYRLDGGPWNAYGSPLDFDADGIHTVEYRSTDVAGNLETTRSVVLRIDTTPPEVEITSPSGPLAGLLGIDHVTLAGQDVVVAATATDATSGMARVELAVDGSVVDTDTDGSDGWSMTWDTTGTGPGLYELTAVAVDEAGNRGEDNITVLVL